MNSASVRSRWWSLAGGRGSLKRQLIGGSAGSAGVQALSRVLGLALGIVLARSLGAELYGIYAYAFAIAAVLTLFAEFGVPTLLLREVAVSSAEQDWPRMRGVLTRALQIIATTSIGVSLLLAVSLWVLWDGLPAVERYTLVLVIAILPLNALTRAMIAALNGLQHAVKAQAFEMLARPALVLAGVLALFYFWPQWRLPQVAMGVQLGAALVMAVAACLLLLGLTPERIRNCEPEFDTRRWLAGAAPMILIGGAGIINNQTDILMLGALRTAEDVGNYRVAVQGSVLVAFGLHAIHAVVSPQFARLYAKRDNERLQRLLTTSARVMFLAALPMALLYVLAGEWLVQWIFGEEFRAAHLPLAILGVGQLCYASMGAVIHVLLMTGYEKSVARTMWGTALLNVALNFLLIPQFGIAGAAVATAITTGLLAAWLARLIYRRLGFNPTVWTRSPALSAGSGR